MWDIFETKYLVEVPFFRDWPGPPSVLINYSVRPSVVLPGQRAGSGPRRLPRTIVVTGLAGAYRALYWGRAS